MNESVLKSLEQNKVIRFDYRKDEDLFYAVQCCDEWFSVPLTRDELLMLADEIKKLSQTEGGGK